MKRIAVILFLLACIQAALADTRLVMVDGYCYLEGQSEHSETKVKFIKVSPSAITDSTYTDSSGYFFMSDLREGIYDIEYSHSGFDTERLEDQLLVSGTTLPPVTLNWPFCNVDGYCYLENQTIHWATKVKFVKASPSAVTDSTYTDSSGYFIMGSLHDGTYDVEYTHDTFDTVLVEDQVLDSATTLPSVTLQQSGVVTVDGYCYLECETNHSGTKVKFIKVSPSAQTDSTYTDSSGYFLMIDLREGIYDVEYSHTGFGPVVVEDQALISNTTLPPVSFPLPPLFGLLSGVLSPGAYSVIGEIWVNSGDSLRLLPGTTICFNGPYPFRIYGTLLAEGMEGDSIAFTTEQSGSNRWRGLRFEEPNSSGSRLAYCLVEKGYATGSSPDNCGGGVFCDNSSPTFTNCTVSGNSASLYGGGVSCNHYSSPTFTNCTVSGNWAGGGGGGVYCTDNSSPTFSNCTLSGNSTNYYGGGVYCYSSSSPSFTNCTLSGNGANYGGGVHCSNSSPTFTNSTLRGNSAYYAGGGVYCYSSSPTFTNCSLSGNSINYYGGGVYCTDNSSPTFSNCTLSGNSARYGGGVYCSSSSPTFMNCTISGNSASYYGGGAYCYSYSPSFKSTIIAFSTSSGIYFRNSAGSQVIYCDIFGNSGGNFEFYNNDPSYGPPMIGVPLVTNANADSVDIYMNIFLDPMFADTAAGDFHLTDFSHCIGAGDPADTVNTDFEGDPRPNPPGSNPDIGMDENPHGAAIPGLVISVDNGNAVLEWLPFGMSETVYNIYGSALPFAAGTLLHSTTNTNWTDEETSSRPSLYFYYVTMEESGQVMR